MQAPWSLRLCFQQDFCLGNKYSHKKSGCYRGFSSQHGSESIAATPNGEYIYVINDSGGVSVISIATNEDGLQPYQLTPTVGDLNSLAISPMEPTFMLLMP